MVAYFKFCHTKELPYKPENKENGFSDMMALARDGLPEAQYLVGSIYECGDCRGAYLIKKNINAAREWLEKAARQGNIAAMGRLGLLYNELKDKKKGEEWIRQAADFGNKFSANVMYTSNPEESFRYMFLAHERGLSQNRTELCWMYLKGVGTPQNVERARELYRRLPAEERTRKLDPIETHLAEIRKYFG